MKTLLLFLLTGFGNQSDSSFVYINLRIKGQESNFIRLEKPYTKDFFLSIYQGDNSIKQIGGNDFNLQIPYSSSSFFEIYINNEMPVAFALNAGDTINIQATKIPKSGFNDYEIIFSGKNKDAHRIFRERFNPPGKNFGFFDDLSKKDTSYSSFYLKSKKYIDSLTAVWDSLKNLNIISDEVY
ncbi:MAG TPA: hypothetical protein VJT83_02910, partial [Chitinophagaceae bacterium]|nr:hypothetical protein [Chitinophagaceae bacterium]